MARQLVRNRGAFGVPWDEMPVFGTSAARFDDDGVTALYQQLRGLLRDRGLPAGTGAVPTTDTRVSTRLVSLVPPQRAHYLAEIAQAVRGYHRRDGRAGRARPPAPAPPDRAG